MLLQACFSAEGLARLTATPARQAYGFASMLHRATFRDGKDWKVWHYCGDFPLAGLAGVETQWVEIS